MPQQDEWPGDVPTMAEEQAARKWRIGLAAFLCLVAFAVGMAALVGALK